MLLNYIKLFLLSGIGWLIFPSTAFSQDCVSTTSDSCQLVIFYELTNGANWTGQTWNLSMPVTTWSGTQWTTIDGALYIKTLNVVNRGLDGDISSLSLALPALEKLYLDNNQLTGQLPHFTATDLPKLKELTLESNQLTGTIPNFNLPNLEILSLSENKLEGVIPPFDQLNNLLFLALNNNQLSGAIPNFAMSSLAGLYVHHNQLSGILPSFPNNLEELWLHHNRFTFTHLNPIKSHGVYTPNSTNNSTFVYAPQDSVGQARTKQITILHPEDRTDSLLLIYGGNHYQIFEKHSDRLFFESQSDEITLENLSRRHDKTYTTTITHSDFPALILYHRPITLSVIGLDFWGASYVPDEIIVKFSSNASDDDRSDLREEFGAELVTSCQNNRTTIERWSFSDPHRIEALSDTFNINGTPSRVKKRSRINDVPVQVGFNYQNRLILSNNSEPTEDMLGGYDEPEEGGTINVALIDSGVQADLARFQQNPNLQIIDPLEHNSTDEFGQGTHIASVISYEIADNIQLNLHPLKIYDESGLGTLFDALCALYKAYEIEPDMINFNWHQQSEYDSLLATSLVDAPTTTLLVIPAGDQAADTNDAPHYPTNLDLPNGVTVQAADETTGILAPFSNYSPDSVDVAVHGVNIAGYKANGQSRNRQQNSLEARDGTAMAAAIFTKKAIYEQLTHQLSGSDLKEQILSSNAIETSSELSDKNKAGGLIPMPPMVSSAPLPLHLLGFSIDWWKQEKMTSLTWTSILMRNFSHFEVERADASLIFTSIGKVAAKNTVAETAYHFFDTTISPHQHTYFYRLKMLDKDGQFTYSNIQSITINPSDSWHIYPNPFQDKFYINLGAPATTIIVQLYNSLGQQVRLWTFSNLMEFALPTTSLPNGIYTVNIQADRERINYKIVKSF